MRTSMPTPFNRVEQDRVDLDRKNHEPVLVMPWVGMVRERRPTGRFHCGA
jgi:hypothetical protein